MSEPQKSSIPLDDPSNLTRYNSIQFKIQQVWTLSIKNIVLYYRRGPVLMFGLLFPFFIALTWIMGRTIPDTRLFVGIITMTLFFTSSAISPVILPWETREKGLERQITSPMNLSIIIWGVIVSSLLYSLGICLIIVLVLAITIGISFVGPLAIIGFLAGAFLISLLGSIIGILVSAPPTDQLPDIMTISNLVKFPLIYISGIFVPLSELAPPSDLIAWFSPLTPFVDLAAYCVGETAILPFYLELGLMLLWCVVLYVLSMIAHNKTFTKRFSK